MWQVRELDAAEFDPRWWAAPPGWWWPASWNVHGRAVYYEGATRTFFVRREPGEVS